MAIYVNRIRDDPSGQMLAWHIWNDRGQVLEVTHAELNELIGNVVSFADPAHLWPSSGRPSDPAPEGLPG